MRLLAFPLFAERIPAFGDERFVPRRINERIRRARFAVFIFALEIEVRAVRAQKKVHRQIQKQSEPPFVIIRDLRIITIANQDVSRVDVRAADNHRVQCARAIHYLHCPGGASGRVAGRESGSELGVA